MDALLNWLWQGCVITLATAAILRVLRRVGARLRYYVCWAGLLMVLGLPILPVVFPATGRGAPLEATVVERLVPVVSVPHGPWMTSTVPMGLWILWVTVCGGRVAVALLALRRAKVTSRRIPSALEARLRHWVVVNAQGRRSRLVVSEAVRSAVVLGLGSPLIALSPRLLDQLTDDELDRVVIHEWAHVQRRDDVANLIQQIALVVAGWHPAMWWIDRQLHMEREVSCDEVAAAVTGSRKAYAACLAKLASIRLVPLTSLPAPGALSSSGVGKRIVRILDTRPAPIGRSVIATGVGVAVLSAVALIVGSLEVIVTATPARAAAGDLGQRPVLHTASSQPDPTISPLSTATTQTRRATPHRHTRVPGEERRAEPRRAAPAPVSVPQKLIPRDVVSVPVDPQEKVSAPAVSAPVIPATTPLVSTLADWPRPSLDPSMVGRPPDVDVKRPSPWGAAADAGVAVGRGSHRTAVATAGFFRRVAKNIASSF